MRQHSTGTNRQRLIRGVDKKRGFLFSYEMMRRGRKRKEHSDFWNWNVGTWKGRALAGLGGPEQACIVLLTSINANHLISSRIAPHRLIKPEELSGEAIKIDGGATLKHTYLDGVYG